MAEPLVSFRDPVTLADITLNKWEIGTILAGNAAPDKTFLIWNNFDGAPDISDINDCDITTSDSVGDTSLVVADKWVETWCPSLGETDEDRVQTGGETNKHVIGAVIGGVVTAGTISGARLEANLGVPGTLADVDNYAEVSLRVTVPLLAKGGLNQFKTRLSYTHI